MYLRLVIFTLFISNFIFGQNYQKYHYTIEEGLPSNECHAIVQDTLGAIWIATDRGISRFDGYTFQNFSYEHGLGDISCIHLQKFKNGHIGVLTLSNKLYAIDPHNFKISSYEHNHLIEKYAKGLLCNSFSIDESENIVMTIKEFGILMIDSKGHAETYPHSDTAKVIKLNNKYFLKNSAEKKNSSIIEYDNKLITGQYDNYFSKNLIEIANDEFFIFDFKYINYFANGKYQWGKKEDYVQKINKSKSNKYYVCKLGKNGLIAFDNIQQLKNEKGLLLLKGVSVSNVCEDKSNILYVSTLEDGLFILKPTNIDLLGYRHATLSNEINSLISLDHGELIMIANNNMILSYTPSLKMVNKIASSNQKIQGLSKIIQINNYFIYNDGGISYYKNRESKKEIFTINPISGRITANIKKIKQIADNKLLAITSGGIELYNNLDQLPYYISKVKLTGIFDAYYHNKDSILIADKSGLFWFYKDKICPISSNNPFFQRRVNEILKYKNYYILASLGSGLGIWDGKNNIRTITQTEGLVSNYIEGIHIHNDIIFAHTNYGVSAVENILQSKPIITNITKTNGLPTNKVNDLVLQSDTLYLATSKGLVAVKLENKSYPTPTINITSLQINQIIKNKDESIFKSNENNITIHFKSIDFNQTGNIKYSYRINESPWEETTNTSCGYLNLNPGNYKFEVKASNSKGEWGTIKTYSFTINKPFYKTFWFITLCLSTLIGSTIAFFNRKISIEKEKNKMKLEIANLEKSALQAQMNPHFIFNCLNSIQSYIMKNDKESAMDYLSNFAKLIRQNLKFSTQEKISLDDEISMLNTYVGLEKIRYNHFFDFKMEVDEKIDLLSTKIPPLLIQPFIENAIIHGMKEKKLGGEIRVTFLADNNTLDVIIADNGMGFKNGKREIGSSSLGMSITEKRLAHINALQGEKYTIDINSHSTGTTVKIKILL